MRGTLRWARADLRARRGQALTTIAVVAGVVTALFLAIMLLQGPPCVSTHAWITSRLWPSTGSPS